MNEDDDTSGYSRLEAQIDWCDKKSGDAQRAYKKTKYFTIIASASIPVVSVWGFEYVQYLVALLGAAIAIFEGMSHVNQW